MILAVVTGKVTMGYENRAVSILPYQWRLLAKMSSKA